MGSITLLISSRQLEEIMKVTAICLLLGITLTAASPVHYNGLETPSYEVLESAAGYELRRYPDVTLVRVQMYGATFEEVEGTMFQKLFSYLSMGNVEGEKIEMTTPVVSAFNTRECAVCENLYEMNFVVPSVFMTNPPTPLDGSGIEIVNQPSIDVYVRQFQSFIFFDEQWIKEGTRLFSSLMNGGVDQTTVETSQLLVVTYDGPGVWFNRRNEVWIVKKPLVLP